MSDNTDTGTAVPNLNNSRPFDVWKVSYSRQLKDVMEVVYGILAKENGNKKNKTKGHYHRAVRAIVMDCYVACKKERNKFIAIPCGASAYASGTRMHKLRFKHKVVLRALNDLAEIGLIQRYPGFYNPEDGSGRLTRIIATEALVGLFDSFLVDCNMIQQSESKPVIVLKDENKHEIDYRNTAVVRQMESNVRRINTAMANNCINLFLSDDGHKYIEEMVIDDEFVYHAIDEEKTSLYRVFNNRSFEQGGRFYGAWYHGLPSNYRRLIQINGKETVELDYSALHPTMLYCIEGITDIPEPYMLPGLDPSYRSQVKPILNIMFNAKSKLAAIQAVNKDEQKTIKLHTLPEPFCNAKYLVEQYLAKHPRISKYMNSNWGVKLQYQDSTMAEEIMLSLLDEDILVLPIHDSFVVTQDNEQRLEQKMIEVFQKRYRYKINIKKNDKQLAEVQTEPCHPDDYRNYLNRLHEYQSQKI